MMNELNRLQHDLGVADHPRRAEYERVAAELAFAAELETSHPGQFDRAGERLAAARDRVFDARGRSDEVFAETVRDIEAGLADFAAAAKTYTMRCVGHAHIDMNWMWAWPETVAVTLDTFRTMLRLMDEYPGFHFSQSQSACYRIVEKYDPALLDRIRARVREGRWEVLASHWVENDSNMAAPGALVQHLRHSRRFMRDLFGLTPEDVPVNWAPDTFTGHSARVPTYLAQGGVKHMYTHRIGPWFRHGVGAFWWEAADGSRVLFYNSEDTTSFYNESPRPEIARQLLKFTRETGLRQWLVSCGVGDHGGGPTRRDIERTLDMDAWPVFPRVQWGRVRDYFDWLAENGANLPILRGEINLGANGCMTSMALLKKCNRAGENAALDADLANATAGAAARVREPGVAAWPAALRDEAWRNVLFGHFHDILPGCGVRDTRTHQHGLYQEIIAITSSAESRALAAFAGRVAPALPDQSALRPARPPNNKPGATPSLFLEDPAGAGFGSIGPGFVPYGGWRTEGGVLPGQAGFPDPDGVRRFVLFNPTGHDREEVVELALWDNCMAKDHVPMRHRAFDVHYADGSPPARAQQLREGQYMWGGHQYAVLAFPAKVPAYGYAAIAIMDVEQTPPPADPAAPRTVGADYHNGVPLENPFTTFENEFLRVTVDPRTGGLRRLVDRKTGLALVDLPDNAPPPQALDYRLELPRPGSAWGIGVCRPSEPVRLVQWHRPHAGQHALALEAELAFGENANAPSLFRLRYELRRGEPFLRMRVKGTWVERGRAETGVPNLRWRLPTTLSGATPTCEVPFAPQERPLHVNGEEMVMLEWAAASGELAGQHAGVVVATDSKYGHSLEAGVLSVTLIHATYEPDPIPEVDLHEAAWRVMPFAGTFSPSVAYRVARHLNHPVRAMPSNLDLAHDPAGTWPCAGRFLRCEGAEIFGVEEDNGMIIYAGEVEGKAQMLVLDFADSPLGPPKSAERMDFCGRPTSAVKLAGTAVKVALKPNELIAIKVRFTS